MGCSKGSVPPSGVLGSAMQTPPRPSSAASLQLNMRDPQLKSEAKPPESVSGGLGHQGESRERCLPQEGRTSAGAGRQCRAEGLGALGRMV